MKPLKAWAASILGSAAGSALTVLAGVIIAWAVSPPLRGDIAKILLFSQLLILGGTFAAADYVILNKGLKGIKERVLGSVVPILILFIGIAFFISTKLKLSNNELVWFFLAYAIIFFPVYYIRSILISELLINGHIRYVAAERSVYGAIYFLILISLYVASMLSAKLVVASTLIAEVVSLIYILIMSKKLTSPHVKDQPFNFISLQLSWIKENFKQYLSFLMTVITKNIDKVCVFLLFTSYEIGLYVIAVALPSMLTQFYSKASQDVVFVQSALGKQTMSSLLQPVKIMLSFYVVAFLIMNFYGKEIIELVFGEAYSNSAHYLVYVLTLGFLISIKELLIKICKPIFVVFTIYLEVAYIVFIISLCIVLQIYKYLNIESLVIGISIITCFVISITYYKLRAAKPHEKNSFIKNL